MDLAMYLGVAALAATHVVTGRAARALRLDGDDGTGRASGGAGGDGAHDECHGASSFGDDGDDAAARAVGCGLARLEGALEVQAVASAGLMLLLWAKLLDHLQVGSGRVGYQVRSGIRSGQTRPDRARCQVGSGQVGSGRMSGRVSGLAREWRRGGRSDAGSGAGARSWRVRR